MLEEWNIEKLKYGDEPTFQQSTIPRYRERAPAVGRQ
jgi:hypothetical protein